MTDIKLRIGNGPLFVAIMTKFPTAELLKTDKINYRTTRLLNLSE